jgi:hypothetical protein
MEQEAEEAEDLAVEAAVGAEALALQELLH